MRNDGTLEKVLGPLEADVMRAVWRAKKPVSVRDVLDILNRSRRDALAYTTVMTMMRILEEKGYLKKNRVERAYLYKPTRARQQVIGAMVRDFVDRVFDGAASGLLVHLAKDGKLSKDERRQIRRVIEEMDE